MPALQTSGIIIIFSDAIENFEPVAYGKFHLHNNTDQDDGLLFAAIATVCIFAEFER